VMGVDLRLSAFMHSSLVLFACFPKLSILLDWECSLWWGGVW
jgi:hypothetical protein